MIDGVRGGDEGTNALAVYAQTTYWFRKQCHTSCCVILELPIPEMLPEKE